MNAIGSMALAAGALLASLPARAAEVDAFAKYAGTWKAQLSYVESAHSKAGTQSMTVRNDCWRSGNFYVCNQIIDDKSRALVVFFYDPVAKRFGSYPISVGADTVHPAAVLVDDKSITFPWDMQDSGKTVHMRIVNTFTTPDTLDFRQEYSEDGKTWTTMATGVEHRVDAKRSVKGK
jgi:hypothetical protein